MDETADEYGLSLYPNPAAQQAKLHLSGSSGACTITLSDVSGRIVVQRNAQGESTITLDLSQLPPGTYMASVLDGKTVRMQRLVKA